MDATPDTDLPADLPRRSVLSLAAMLASGLLASQAGAQAAWPSKPIRLVLPSGPGGGADIFSRPMAEWMG
ncbi:MAG: tripartite tricarboxylate transporter substrate binding protein, partial [Aquabacterium sp.]